MVVGLEVYPKVREEHMLSLKIGLLLFLHFLLDGVVLFKKNDLWNYFLLAIFLSYNSKTILVIDDLINRQRLTCIYAKLSHLSKPFIDFPNHYNKLPFLLKRVHFQSRSQSFKFIIIDSLFGEIKFEKSFASLTTCGHFFQFFYPKFRVSRNAS